LLLYVQKDTVCELFAEKKREQEKKRVFGFLTCSFFFFFFLVFLFFDVCKTMGASFNL
jgi:hypothetical protein